VERCYDLKKNIYAMVFKNSWTRMTVICAKSENNVILCVHERLLYICHSRTWDLNTSSLEFGESCTTKLTSCCHFWYESLLLALKCAFWLNRLFFERNCTKWPRKRKAYKFFNAICYDYTYELIYDLILSVCLIIVCIIVTTDPINISNVLSFYHMPKCSSFNILLILNWHYVQPFLNGEWSG
jgi:hypothetical protein